VRFNDGTEGEVFETLKDIQNFKSFRVDPLLETIVWENGADLAPEFLYENTRILNNESLQHMR